MFSRVYAPAWRSDMPMPRLSKVIEPGERTHAFPETGGQRMGHGELEVTDETADHQDVDRTVAADCVRDGYVTVVRIADRVPVHHTISMAVLSRR